MGGHGWVSADWLGVGGVRFVARLRSDGSGCIVKEARSLIATRADPPGFTVAFDEFEMGLMVFFYHDVFPWNIKTVGWFAFVANL